jgi:hypothetical protein
MVRFAHVGMLALFLGGTGGVGFAQEASPGCGAAPVASPTAQPNIFSEQQEEWLGDAMADAIEGSFSPVRDAKLSAHLQAITDRLTATIPQTKIHFQATLVDSSAVNGFSIAGGRIYLTRKLAASAKDDDELAAVLGHEIGHIASHQFAFETTRDLKRLTGVSSVGDRADIFAKFQALMTAELSDKHPVARDDEDKQDEADRIGVYVTAAAGYRPQAGAEFWNRVFFVNGKTRGKVADFFGITKPNEKRLRGMLALAASLPAGCGGTLKPDEQAFDAWRAAVVANQTVVAQVEMEGAVKAKLNPPLRMGLDRVRFSPDGKLILAQDASSVFVLQRTPLTPLFRFDADDAQAAMFSPDSQKIVFSTPGMHTEEWSVGEKKLVAAHEPLAPHPCVQSIVSPDGRTLICVWMDNDAEYGSPVGLMLIDTTSGAVVWNDKGFMHPSWSFYFWVAILRGEGVPIDMIPYSISPDGNLLVIGQSDAKLAMDLRTRQPIEMAHGLKDSEVIAYAFVGNDRLLQMNGYTPKNSGTFTFPDGRLVKKLDANLKNIQDVSDGSGAAVLADGPNPDTTGIADLDGNKYLMMVKTAPLDEQGGEIVTEGVDGAVVVGKLRAESGVPGELLQTALPISPLSRSRGMTLSLDGRYLAISSRLRGGVWEVDTGKRMFLVKGFRESSWDEDGNVYGEFTRQVKDDKPAKGGPPLKDENYVGKLILNANKTQVMNYKLDDKTRLRFGLLMEWKDDGKKGSELIMHKLSDDSTMWSKSFPAQTSWYTQSFGERDLIFNYPVKTEPAKSMLKADANLLSEANAIKDKSLGRLIEVVDQATGKTEAEMVLSLPLNYNGTNGLNRAGDLLYVTGDDHRTMVYALSTGKQLRQMFGEVEAVDPETGRVCTGNRADEAVVYDAKGTELAHYHLGDTVRFVHFREHGKQLVVLTADQTVWTLKVDGAVQEKATK